MCRKTQEQSTFPLDVSIKSTGCRDVSIFPGYFDIDEKGVDGIDTFQKYVENNANYRHICHKMTLF